MATVYKIGSFVADAVTGITQLAAGTATAENYDCFEKAGTNYVVPTGKTFYITKIIWTGRYNAGRVEIGYADTAADDVATAPTAYVSLTAGARGESAPFGTEADLPKEADVFFVIPAGKYPHIRAKGCSISVVAFGVEL